MASTVPPQGGITDHLPATLQTLYCSHNKIISVDNIPANLKNIICCCNGPKISVDNHLLVQICFTNKITSLEHLAANPAQERFWYDSDQTTFLERLPATQSLREIIIPLRH
jgi:hypothetical protein